MGRSGVCPPGSAIAVPARGRSLTVLPEADAVQQDQVLVGQLAHDAGGLQEGLGGGNTVQGGALGTPQCWSRGCCCLTSAQLRWLPSITLSTTSVWWHPSSSWSRLMPL